MKAKKPVVPPSAASMGEAEAGPYAAAMQEFGVKFADYDLLALCKEMQSAQRALDKLDVQHARVQGAYDLLRYTLVPQRMEKDKVTTTVFKGIGRLSTTDDVFVSVKGGMKEKLYAWLRKNKLGDLIVGTVNSSTLKASMTKRFRDGKPIPQDLINFTPVERATITKIQ